MSDAHAIDAGIRAVLAAHARLPQPVDRLAAPADLFQAGMSSHASVDVMLALEEAFAVEFPDEMLTRQVFGSIAGIRQALLQLGVQ